MKVYAITDGEYCTQQFEHLYALLEAYFNKKGYQMKSVAVNKSDLAPCMGCFGCWIKKPGECVINDRISEINRTGMNSDVLIFLTPVIFGQFSANIKNALDRWLPNMLPFFETRPDGSTIHPPRYRSYPKQIAIGYGDGLDEKDVQLFTDITLKHRSNVDAMVYTGDDSKITNALEQIKLERVGGQL